MEDTGLVRGGDRRENTGLSVGGKEAGRTWALEFWGCGGLG